MALGFPYALYERISDPGAIGKAKAQIEPLSVSTREYVECRIARELGMTVQAYQSLPRRERQRWYFFTILEKEKEIWAYDEAQKEAELKAQTRSKSPVR